jgi:hypothetical protein
MRLPEYDDCSLEELRRFLRDRHIPFKFTRAQAHTKTLYKRDKEERRRLTATLDKADTAATFRFMDMPIELRDQIYDCILTNVTQDNHVTIAELRAFMWRVSPQFCAEARGVFRRGEYENMPELVAGPPLPARSTHRLEPRAPTAQAATSGQADAVLASLQSAISHQRVIDHLFEGYGLALRMLSGQWLL